MTLHLKSRGYPFRPRVLFSSFIVVGVGFPNCVLFQERTHRNHAQKYAFYRTAITANKSVSVLTVLSLHAHA